MLVGTDEGLFLLELNKTADSRSFIRIEGVASVALMSLVAPLGKIVMVTGKDGDFTHGDFVICWGDKFIYLYTIRVCPLILALVSFVVMPVWRRN